MTFDPSNKSIKFKLCGANIRILLALPKFQTNKQLAKHLKRSEGTVSYHTSRLEKAGLIKAVETAGCKIFELTNRGKKACLIFLGEGATISPNDIIIRVHDLQFISKIIRQPKALKDKLLKNNWIEFCPRNWKGYKKNIRNAIVIFTPKSVQYLINPYYTKDKRTANKEAVRTILEIKHYLEGEYRGLLLGKPEEVAVCSRQSYGIQMDPLAIKYDRFNREHKTNRSYRSDRLNIDQSVVPETETVHPVHAPDDLSIITQNYEDMVRHGIRLKELKTAILSIEKNLQQMTRYQKKIADVIEASTEHMVKMQGLQIEQFTNMMNRMKQPEEKKPEGEPRYFG